MNHGTHCACSLCGDRALVGVKYCIHSESGQHARTCDRCEDEQEIQRLGDLVRRLLLERKAILSVQTTDGLTASEWLLRTGIAEQRAKRLTEQRDALLSLLGRALDYLAEEGHYCTCGRDGCTICYLHLQYQKENGGDNNA